MTSSGKWKGTGKMSLTNPNSEAIFAQAEKLREQVAKLDDKLTKDILGGVVFAILGTFCSVLTLLSWYFEKEMGGDKAGLAVQVPYYGVWAVMALVLGFTTSALVYVFRIPVLKKRANAAQNLAERLEKSEQEMQLKKAAQKLAAEAGAKAKAASDASLISQKIETTEQMQASRVAKAVQETRDERRQEKTDGRKGPRGTTP